MQFETEVRSFLQSESLLFAGNSQTQLRSFFPLILMGAKPVYLHCISVSKFAKHAPDENYFSGLSDEAESKKIKLIHLWEDVWMNNRELVKLRLLAICGRSKRIHARQTEIVRIDKKQADEFLISNHLQYSTNAYYKYGLTRKGELVAVATFSKSRIMHDGPALYRSYELVRFCSLKGTTVTGGLGKLLHHFINEHHPAHIMTYADRDWSFGEGYKKLGFVFDENTPAQHFFIHPSNMVRLYPHRLEQSGSELLQSGYVKVANAGNSKFILDRRVPA